MSGRWMTLNEVAAARKITLTEAQSLLDAADCPKIFKTKETLYLVKLLGL